MDLRRFVLGFGFIAIGCGGTPGVDHRAQGASKVPIVQPAGWMMVEAAEDPFEDRPSEVRCLAPGYVVEGDAVEVETDRCTYLTAVQPLLQDLLAGQSITTVAWHSKLTALESAEGHMALRIEDTLIWELTVPIPSTADVYTLQGTVPRPVPAGAPVYFHVHNHGQNSWKLGPTTVGGER